MLIDNQADAEMEKKADNNMYMKKYVALKERTKNFLEFGKS